MSRNTPSQNVFFELMTTYADDEPLVTHMSNTRTTTQAATSPIIDVVLDDDKWPEGYKSVEQLVAESEKDPKKRAALEDARRWVATTFYPKEDSLRTLRLKKGLSQARLAALVGTTQSHIARVESGATDVQVGTLMRLAQALGIDDMDAFKAFLGVRRAVTS